MPLAARIRPKDLNGFVGQEHLVGENKPLRKAIDNKHIFSFLLWGPPGTGKTTLARIYANSVDAEFIEISAVSAGKDDLRKIIDRPPILGQRKILFIDEIHRFNKAQQDFLLPYVENGQLTLIGATTENPSFEVIPALLSRCRVFVLNSHTDDSLKSIIKSTGIEIDDDSLQFLADHTNNDARQALTLLENTVNLYQKATTENLKNTMQSRFLRYDKKGEEHYNTISAFIKSMRNSKVDAALYYLARMLESGEDPKFIARRMIIFASEDIGLASTTALVIANEVFKAVETIGMPECRINLAHGVIFLCSCKKDRRVYDAIEMAITDAKNYGNLPIPLKLRNAVTKLMKDIGYGKDYEMYNNESFMPDELKGKKYFV